MQVTQTSEWVLQWIVKGKKANALCSRLTGSGGVIPRFPSPIKASVHDDLESLERQVKEDVARLAELGIKAESKR
jgi:hypothetical protein